MRLADLLSLPLVALWQQKTRTLLTTLGVIFGAFVLAASLSIGDGVQKTINREMRRVEFARRIEVSVSWGPAAPAARETRIEGTFNESRRQRLLKSQQEMSQRTRFARPKIALNQERLALIRALPHVEQVVPDVNDHGFAILENRSVNTTLCRARPDDETCKKRVVAGRFFESPAENAAVITEDLAYRLGVRSDAALDALVGTPLVLEFRAPKTEAPIGLYLANQNGDMTLETQQALETLMDRLPDSLEKLGLSTVAAAAIRGALKKPEEPTKPMPTTRETLTIAGVLRAPSDEELNAPHEYSVMHAGVLLPYETAAAVFFRGPDPKRKEGLNNASVLVDHEDHVKPVLAAIRGLGLEARAMVQFIDRQRLIYLLIFAGMTCVAAVALVVSAIGIGNTMFMSILERTREIGIMKAIGADNLHLQLIFLIEGAVIGVVGGILGLLLALAASYPGDSWVRSMVNRDLDIKLEDSIFVFPPWLAASVIAFTALVAILAAVYPARHAARIDPVKALRHE